MVLTTYLKNAVPTVRFEPSRRGFAANWSYFYDKPMDMGLAAGQGNASSGATLTDDDAKAAVALRQLDGLKTHTDHELLVLAAQARECLWSACMCASGGT